MTIILHPSYFPNVWTTAAMVQADEIIFEQHDNYQKQTYRNRCIIYGANGPLSLVVPVHHTQHQRKLFREVEISKSEKWQINHWRSIQSAYRNSPFFEYYEASIAPFFVAEPQRIMSLCLQSLKLVTSLLDYDLEYKLSESYKAEVGFTDLRRLIKSRKESLPAPKRYIQVFSDKYGFIPNLSILDLIFNEGPASLNYLKSLDLSLIGSSEAES